VGDDRDADAAREVAPFSELEDVLGDVRFFELAAVLSQPILGEFAVGSGGGGVDLDLRHSLLPRLRS
jgi:hypothetical protein